MHKDHWEVYKDKKSYEKGKRSFDVWEDGRFKGKKSDSICEQYSKEKIKINTWLEDDVFFIQGDTKSLMFLSDLIKAQAMEIKDDNVCIGPNLAGNKFFSKKAKFGILIHNTDSAK